MAMTLGTSTDLQMNAAAPCDERRSTTARSSGTVRRTTDQQSVNPAREHGVHGIVVATVAS